MTETILVCGATGTIGGPTVEALVERGANVRALVRNPDKAAQLERRGVRPVMGDLSSVESLRPALRGVRRLFMLVPGSPYQPDQVELAGHVLDAVKGSEVERIVYLSMWDAGRSVHRPQVMRNHAQIEDAIIGSGVKYTFLQTTFTMQALLAQGLGRSAATDGRIYTPFGEAGVAFIDARDVAKAAAVCLTSSEHDGKTYELSGPEALTSAALAATIGKVLGRPIVDVPLTTAEAIGALTQMGMPAWLTEHMATLVDFNRTGALTRTTPAIAELTGSPAGTFEHFVRDHVAAFSLGSNLRL